MAEIIITKDNFDSEVLKSGKPVLLDFWAAWCGPCRMLAPVIEETAEKYEGKIVVGKVNVDEEPELAMRFRIVSIPTLIVMKDGKAVNTAVGYMPAEEVEALLEL